MKTILAILVIALAGLYFYERREADLLRGKVAQIQGDYEFLSEELFDLEKRFKTKTEALIELLETLEVAEDEQEIQPRVGVTIDNSNQISTLRRELSDRENHYQTERNKIDAEIVRGRVAQQSVSNLQPNFLDGNIRTSDADRGVWERNKQQRLVDIEHRLRELESEKSKLDLEWNSFRNQQNEKIRRLHGQN